MTGRVRARSRSGVDLTGRVGDLPAVFEEAPHGSLFDGELVAVGGTEERPAQDFGMVCRAVLRGDPAAARRLRFVAFDVLELAGEDLRGRRWSERDRLLGEALPAHPLVRHTDSLEPTQATHAALLALGFEGSVLKRQSSVYRAGRSTRWLKHKARYSTGGVLLAVRQERQRHWHAVCDVGGRRVGCFAGADAVDQVGEAVRLVYSRVDADGGLREARLDVVDGAIRSGSKTQQMAPAY